MDTELKLIQTSIILTSFYKTIILEQEPTTEQYYFLNIRQLNV
jgi:hypothetical protein